MAPPPRPNRAEIRYGTHDVLPVHEAGHVPAPLFHGGPQGEGRRAPPHVELAEKKAKRKKERAEAKKEEVVELAEQRAFQEQLEHDQQERAEQRERELSEERGGGFFITQQENIKDGAMNVDPHFSSTSVEHQKSRDSRDHRSVGPGPHEPIVQAQHLTSSTEHFSHSSEGASPRGPPPEQPILCDNPTPRSSEYADIKKNTPYWVAEPTLICRAGPELDTVESSPPVGRNRIVYSAGPVVYLKNGIVRMPVTKTDDRLHEKLSHAQRQKAVHWITFDASAVDPLKKHMLVEVGDELLFFKVFLMQKYAHVGTTPGNRMGTEAAQAGGGGSASSGAGKQTVNLLSETSLSTGAWYAFYRDMDRNGNNLVSMIEFEAGLLSLKYPDESTDASSRKRRKKLLQLLDKDGSGELTFEEFGAVLGFSEHEIYEAKKQEQERRHGNGVNTSIRWNSGDEFDFHAKIREYGRKTRSTTPSQRHCKGIYSDRSVASAHEQQSSAFNLERATMHKKTVSGEVAGTLSSGNTTLQDFTFPNMATEDPAATTVNLTTTTTASNSLLNTCETGDALNTTITAGEHETTIATFGSDPSLRKVASSGGVLVTAGTQKTPSGAVLPREVQTAPDSLQPASDDALKGFARKSHQIQHPKRWTTRFGIVDKKTPRPFRDYFGHYGLFSTEALIMEQENKILPGTGEDEFSRSTGAPPGAYDVTKERLQKKKNEMVTEMRLFRDFLQAKYGAFGYEGMERIFRMMDTNASDRLGVSAFTAALQSTLKYPGNGSLSHEAQRRRVNLFLTMDLDGMGSLDRYEFCRGLTRQLDAGVNLDEKFTRRVQRWGDEHSKWVLLAQGAKHLKKKPRRVWHESTSLVRPAHSHFQSYGMGGGGGGSMGRTELEKRASKVNTYINVRKKLAPMLNRPGTLGESGTGTTFGPPRPQTAPQTSAELYSIDPAERAAGEDGEGKLTNRDVLRKLHDGMKQKRSQASFLADEHNLMGAGATEDDDEVSDMLKNLQKRFLHQEHEKELRKNRALAETVDYAEMFTKKKGASIAQMAAVANFGARIDF